MIKQQLVYECAIDVVQYGIHQHATLFRPIGRRKR